MLLLLLNLWILIRYLTPGVVAKVIVSFPVLVASAQANEVMPVAHAPVKRCKIASLALLYVIVVLVLVASNHPHASSKSAELHPVALFQ